MEVIILTQYEGAILGPIAKVLGILMNAIFNFLYTIGLPNIGLSIILFTFVIYLALLPLTIRQQKYSKLSVKMSPEINAIQKKYKDKKNDQDAMLMMNEETKAVYAKYGTSPTGSCLFLIIQMPILFALYRVIDNIPAYVSKVKDIFIPFVSKFVLEDGALEFISNKDNFSAVTRFGKVFSPEKFNLENIDYLINSVIDVLNKSTTSEWHNIYAANNYPHLKDLITNSQFTGAYDLFSQYNNFLGINIANSPSYIVKDAWATGSYGMVIGAIMIPLLSAFTQWLNVKLTPQTNNEPTGNEQQDSMMKSMKTMNLMMPLTSAFFCFSLPSGMGLYWIAGSVIRSIQQVVINKILDKEDIDAMIAKNVEKMKKKNAKKGKSVSSNLMEKYSNMSTKSLNGVEEPKKKLSMKEKAALAGRVKDVNTASNNGVKSNSSANNSNDAKGKKEENSLNIAEKANLVKKFNENT